MTAVNLTSYEEPVFTYNGDTNNYNVAFIGYSNSMQGMYFTTINIANYGNTYNLENFRVLTPLV